MKTNLFIHLVRKMRKLICEGVQKKPTFTYRLIEESDQWLTCEIDDIIWKLDKNKYIDQEIIKHGVFERDSISWVKEIVKPGMFVIDVGANFGYYTMIMSKLVGDTGKIFAFEPSDYFYNRLVDHIQINEFHNVQPYKFGLSNVINKLDLFRSDNSACLKRYDFRTDPKFTESVEVKRLDDIVGSIGLSNLDFIKIDIDGHEPFFIEGAINTIKKFKPIIQIEFQELALLENNSDAEILAKQLIDLGYSLFSEHGRKDLSSKTDFLIVAKNCSYSVNLFCFPK